MQLGYAGHMSRRHGDRSIEKKEWAASKSGVDMNQSERAFPARYLLSSHQSNLVQCSESHAEDPSSQQFLVQNFNVQGLICSPGTLLIEKN